MSYKWIGAVLVILGCGSCGWSMVADHFRRERLLRQFLQAVSYMECELSYRLTPLPELCHQAGREVSGSLGKVLTDLALELEAGTCPEASGCMQKVLKTRHDLPGNLRRLLHQLGGTLGRFDLPGQLQGLAAVKNACQRERQQLEENKTERLKSCQTLGLCAGAALVVLFA